MKRLLVSRLVLGALLAALVPAVAPAQVMVSNLSETIYATSPVGAAGPDNYWFANRFRTTDSTPASTLSNVVLSLGEPVDTSSALFVAIYSNVDNAPGALLETLTGNPNPSTAGEYTFTSSGLALAVERSYWIVAGTASGAGSFSWNLTESTSTDGPWRIPTTATHAYSTNFGIDWNVGDGFPRQFSVSTVAAVPEPSQVAMLAGVAALGLIVARRVRGRLKRN